MSTTTMSSQPKSRFRIALAAFAILGVLLSGCYRETVKVKITPKGKVSGFVQFELNTEATKALGMTDSDTSKSKSKKKKLPAGVTVTEVRDGVYEGFRYNLKNVDPATLSYLMANLIVQANDNPPQVLVRNGDTWRFSLSDLDSSDDSSDDSSTGSETPSSTSSETSALTSDQTSEAAAPDAATSSTSTGETGAISSDELNAKLKQQKAVLAEFPPRLIVSITFPGKVIEADAQAKVSGKTASWDITMTPELMASSGTSGELFAVGKAR